MSALLQPSAKARFWEMLERGVLREMGYPALIASLVLFVCAMALLGANVSELRQSYARVQRANEALVQIAMVNADILRVEMSIRGYALSGDPAYLVWKDMAYDDVHGRVASFGAEFAGDPVQGANLRRLNALLEKHRAYFDRLIDMLPAHRQELVAEIVAYSKKVKRRDIEDLLVTMRSDEMKELAKRQLAVEAKASEAYLCAVGISGVAVMLGALGFGLLIGERRRRTR